MEERLLEALKNIIAIVHDSEGVAGYHLNGEIAEWDEFEEVLNAQDLINECAGQKLTREQNNALLSDVTNCPLCDKETLFTDQEKCTTPDCPNCIF